MRNCETVPYEGIHLTPSLQDGREDRAVRVLRHYYRPLRGTKSGFTGGAWDTFDPAGNRTAMVNTFTAEDIVSAALLSARIHGRPAVELLDRRRAEFERLLTDLGPDRDFVDEPSVEPAGFAPAWKLWRALRDLPDIGPTHASKLMARKRPRLIPIYDDVVNEYVLASTGRQWVVLHAALNAEKRALHHRLLQVREMAGLSPAVSPLRVFDVLAWMDGSGNSTTALGSHSEAPDVPVSST
ncbi:MAG: hypothetical protein EOL89_02585 [Actinobacteria bacterium]|nr:hypothetical protein [Actinomycetota bacterium]